MSYEWRRVAGCLTLAIALWTLSRLLPLGGASFVIRGILLFCWPLLVWQVGLLSNMEKEYALHNLRRLSALWPRRDGAAAVREPESAVLQSLPITTRRVA